MSAIDTNIPQIRLSASTNSGAMNCLMLSPIQLVGLGMSGALNGSVDATGLSCMATDLQTGQQCEIAVFQGHQTELTDGTIETNVEIAELVKLIKDSTPELSSVSFPQIDGIVSARKQTARIFDNIRMAVATCGAPSRFYNRCYMTGRDYPGTSTDASSDQLTGRVFSGAKAIYGERHYLVSFQYSKDLEHIFPVADAYFNIMHKLVPFAVAAPALVELAGNREYLKCQVRRTSGLVQTGFIQVHQKSMLIYKFSPDNGARLQPYITVYFKSDGSDIMDVLDVLDVGPYENPDNKIPEHDCFKTVKLSDILNENPGFRECIGTSNDLKFENLILRQLTWLYKGVQL
jgi:hypothetical protein